MVMEPVPNKLTLIRIQNINDYEAAVYFMIKDKRSDSHFYKNINSNDLYVSDKILDLLKEVNIPYVLITKE